MYDLDFILQLIEFNAQRWENEFTKDDDVLTKTLLSITSELGAISDKLLMGITDHKEIDKRLISIAGYCVNLLRRTKAMETDLLAQVLELNFRSPERGKFIEITPGSRVYFLRCSIHTCTRYELVELDSSVEFDTAYLVEYVKKLNWSPRYSDELNKAWSCEVHAARYKGVQMVGIAKFLHDTKNNLNLDAMSRHDLTMFRIIINPDSPGHRELFETDKEGLWQLKSYAINKSVAMELREQGNVDRAMCYEDICENIYKKMKENLKW